MISSAVPLSAIARALDDRLPNLTSSQLPILIPLLRNLGARCDEIEKALRPDVIAPRPLAGPSRAREAAPSPRRLRRRVRRRRTAGAAGAIAARRVLGAVTVIAGRAGGDDDFADGPALEARFSFPYGMVKMDDGALIIADAGNRRIRKLQNGVVTTLAGGERGFADGPAAIARFWCPHGLAFDAQGRVLMADFNNMRIRRVTSEGETTTTATVPGTPTPSGPCLCPAPRRTA